MKLSARRRVGYGGKFVGILSRFISTARQTDDDGGNEGGGKKAQRELMKSSGVIFIFFLFPFFSFILSLTYRLLLITFFSGINSALQDGCG